MLAKTGNNSSLSIFGNSHKVPQKFTHIMDVWKTFVGIPKKSHKRFLSQEYIFAEIVGICKASCGTLWTTILPYNYPNNYNFVRVFLAHWGCSDLFVSEYEATVTSFLLNVTSMSLNMRLQWPLCCWIWGYSNLFASEYEVTVTSLLLNMRLQWPLCCWIWGYSNLFAAEYEATVTSLLLNMRLQWSLWLWIWGDSDLLVAEYEATVAFFLLNMRQLFYIYRCCR